MWKCFLGVMVNRFNWEETENEGKLDAMFTTGTVEEGVVLTRDPRLYESAIVNGMQKQMDWNTGNMSGTIYELWSGGTDAKEEPANVAGKYTAGYANNKFYMDTDYKNVYAHWAYLQFAGNLLDLCGSIGCKQAEAILMLLITLIKFVLV